MKMCYARMFLLAAVLSWLPGCGSIEMYATRAAQMENPKAPRLESVMLNDRPAIVVHLSKHCGWGAQVGQLWIEEAVTGHAVWETSEFMRSGSTHCFIPPNLTPGTFIVVLKAEGEPMASLNFDVK